MLRSGRSSRGCQSPDPSTKFAEPGCPCDLGTRTIHASGTIMNVTNFIRDHFRHFNAAALVDAADG